MLQLKDNTLFPFSPSYRRRNKLAVAYDPKASCPLFLDTLMRPALETDDLDLIQRWCGLALIGENLAQKIVILTGTPGGGKGTLIQIINGIIGQINLAALRPQLLGERFEVGRFLGKTLLYGADVPENFLNQRGASILKSLTGGDPVTLEFKNSMSRQPLFAGSTSS
jgi:Predicted ATPase